MRNEHRLQNREACAPGPPNTMLGVLNCDVYDGLKGGTVALIGATHYFNAPGPSAGSSPADAPAFEAAARAAAILCATARRTACNIPAAFLPRASSARARRTPDSNIAPSNLEAVAFHLPRANFILDKERSCRRRFEKNPYPVKLAGLCAHAFSVSRKMSAISCGPLPTQISPEMDRVERRFGNIRKIASVRGCTALLESV